MKFSSPPINEAVERLIGMRKEQLRQVEEDMKHYSVEHHGIKMLQIKKNRQDLTAKICCSQRTNTYPQTY